MRLPPSVLVAILLAIVSAECRPGSLVDNVVNSGLRNIGQGTKNVTRSIKDGVEAIGEGIKSGVDSVKEGVGNLLPDCVIGVDRISFVLFTRNYPEGTIVHMNDTDLPIVSDGKVRFLIHGFTSEANATNYFDLASAWLDKADVNVFSVQWKEGACTTGGLPLTDLLSYPSALVNTEDVGDLVANFTNKLVNHYGVRVNEIVVVGHSLGAHVSGFAGKAVQKLGLDKYGMIIGLDPAGPGFSGANCEKRLCKTDANFVEVMHTSSLGIQYAFGKVDFFFNNALSQPGCLLVTCSHSRSVEYMTESIRNENNCTFLGVPYANNTSHKIDESQCTPQLCSIAGLKAIDYQARGSLYVSTSAKAPYCLDNNYP